MASQPSPVTPEVVRWAVDEDGRTLAELADALNVNVDTLDGWASGDTTPSRGDVSKLATVLKRPRALFFLPRAPASATLPANFRHPPGDDRAVSATARRKVREARRVQHAVAWALRESGPVAVPEARLSDSPDRVAAKARAWLGVTDSDQASWVDDRAALRAWRTALDARGILVFILEIGRDDVRGFSAWDDHAPLIVANLSGVNPAARSFTLAHELGHLLTRLDAACVEPGDNGTLSTDVERWCERFGSALLMPSTQVQKFIAQAEVERGRANLDDVRAMMRRFRVSARAAALRLIDTRFATHALYGEVLRTFVPEPPRETDGSFKRPARAVARVREYGPRAVRTVLEELPPRDALSVLRLTMDDIQHVNRHSSRDRSPRYGDLNI